MFWELHSFICPYTYSILKLESTVLSPLLSSGLVSPPIAFFHFFPCFLLFQLPFSISLFPSANWPSQAGLGLYISGFEATSETKAKLWVWFGLRRAYWPRRVVFLGQTRERWGGEKNLCESSCVAEENPITTANLNVLLSRGWGGGVNLGWPVMSYNSHSLFFKRIWVEYSFESNTIRS